MKFVLPFLFLAVLLATADAAVDTGCGPQYHADATALLQPTPKEGFGVLWVAHHCDRERHEHFTRLAITSAETYKSSSPRVPRAFITSFADGESVLPGA